MVCLYDSAYLFLIIKMLKYTISNSLLTLILSFGNSWMFRVFASTTFKFNFQKSVGEYSNIYFNWNVHVFDATFRLTLVKKNRQNGERRKRSNYLEQGSATFSCWWATSRPSKVPAGRNYLWNEVNSKIKHFLAKLTARTRKKIFARKWGTFQLSNWQLSIKKIEKMSTP